MKSGGGSVRGNVENRIRELTPTLFTSDSDAQVSAQSILQHNKLCSYPQRTVQENGRFLPLSSDDCILALYSL
jgi:hypothetical protein